MRGHHARHNNPPPAPAPVRWYVLHVAALLQCTAPRRTDQYHCTQRSRDACASSHPCPQDLALCQLRGESPRGHVALWPEAALAGHSCAPSATAYAVGDRLVMRAAADIPQGACSRCTARVRCVG